MVIDSIKNRILSFYKTVKSISKGKWDFVLVSIDYIYSRLRFHINGDEYLKYNFYNYKNRYRKNFVLVYHQKKYKNICVRFATRSKYLFYKKVPEFYQRGMLLAPYCGVNQFLDFAKRYKKLILKPDCGSLGLGLELFEYTDDESAIEFYNKLPDSKATIIEEYITQHEKMKALNPSSVNTVRVVSILYEGQIEIVSATLKCAASCDQIFDNMHQGGIAAQLDIETGIATTHGRDYNFNCYHNHPGSGVQFIGFSVPHWQKVIDLVKKAHKRLPECLILGWDIAITPTGVDLVEANNSPGPKLMQTMDQIPKGEKIIKMVKSTKIKQDYSKNLVYKPDYEKVL